MKKSIVSAVILLAVLLGSCSGAGTDTQDSANSTDAVTQGAQTSAVSTEADTAAVTTEAENTEATDAAPAFDINDEHCLPYRLINMTYSEIEAEFGPLKQVGWWYGGAPAYKPDTLDGVWIAFIRTSGKLKEANGLSLADTDDKPGEVYVSDEDMTVYPGLKNGMTGKEVYEVLRKYYPDISSEQLTYDPVTANMHYFISFAVREDCGITLKMDISGLEDEYPDLYTGTPEDFDYEKSEQRLFDEEIGTLGYIKIYEIINQ